MLYHAYFLNYNIYVNEIQKCISTVDKIEDFNYLLVSLIVAKMWWYCT